MALRGPGRVLRQLVPTDPFTDPCPELPPQTLGLSLDAILESEAPEHQLKRSLGGGTLE